MSVELVRLASLRIQKSGIPKAFAAASELEKVWPFTVIAKFPIILLCPRLILVCSVCSDISKAFAASLTLINSRPSSSLIVLPGLGASCWFCMFSNCVTCRKFSGLLSYSNPLIWSITKPGINSPLYFW